jgi:hypothetical protein
VGVDAEGRKDVLGLRDSPKPKLFDDGDGLLVTALDMAR